MLENKIKYYPTTIDAIHLLVLYIFLQSLIDFPLAMYDYTHDTNYLSNYWINFFSNFLITGFIFYYGFKRTTSSLKQAFALKTFNVLLIIPLLFILPGLQHLVGYLNIIVEKVLPAPGWFWELFDRIFQNRFGFWGTLFKVAILAPVIEEALFRGIIMHGFMKNYKPWYAILISALLFSLFHLNPWQMTYTFFLGILLGWLMVRTRSLPLAIIAHSLNNLLVLLSITYSKEINQRVLKQIGESELFILSSVAITAGVLIVIGITRKRRNKSRKQTIPETSE
jgi:uncharacterized protein